MYCRLCGAENAENAERCAYCDAKLTEEHRGWDSGSHEVDRLEPGWQYSEGFDEISTSGASRSRSSRSALPVVSLVLGILGLVTCMPLFSLGAIVIGALAMKEVDSDEGRMNRKAMAKAGIILGATGVFVLGLLLLVLLVAS